MRRRKADIRVDDSGVGLSLLWASPEPGRARPVEGDPQSQPAAEPVEDGSVTPPASAPASGGGPASWEAAFAQSDADALNRGSRPDPETSPATPADPAAPEKDAAPDAGAAPAGEDGEPKPEGRDPQPGSRRSTAAELEAQKAENERLKEQFETWAKERDEQAAAAQKRQEDEDKAKAEAASAVEDFMGKPGEMAALLAKQSAWTRGTSQEPFTSEDDQRLADLVHGTRLYAPLLAKARAEVAQEHGSAVTETEGRLNGLIEGLSAKVREAGALEGVDAAFLEKESDLHEIHKHIHAVAFKAGAASRDGEMADLLGQLTDAKSNAFVSQPRLATGGVSGSGRSTPGYDPQKSPVSNLEQAYAEEAAPSGNGRR